MNKNIIDRETNFKSIKYDKIINSNYTYREGTMFNSWNLFYFKIKKCKKIVCNNQNICIFYHGEYDKRRSLLKYEYDIKLCKNSKNCKLKKNCNFSHNKIEILYHPFFYKKKYCYKFLQKNNCVYNKFCSFAHSNEELRINLLHTKKFDYNFFLFFYKTEFCPLGNIEHDKNWCVYAHNFQDYKRRSINRIIPIKCRNWNLNISYSNYNSGCVYSKNCKYSHGWKELCYNPLIYKTKICDKKLKSCLYKNSCHYFHNDSEKIKFKKLDNDILNIVPINSLSNKKVIAINYSKLKNKTLEINRYINNIN